MQISLPNTSRKDATAAMFGKLPSQNVSKGITLNVTEKINVPSTNNKTAAAPALGTATANNQSKDKTWDGFKNSMKSRLTQQNKCQKPHNCLMNRYCEKN